MTYLQNGYNKKRLKIPSIYKNMEQWEISHPAYTAGGYANWYYYFRKQFGTIY